ncbi:MAG: chemotaxis protein CheW [Desulfuromonadaceae bacterium]|nr:chemotaxis protein CheW [Desulfuromonadaceae bacterium]MDD2854434.1 chemotaxis protein CheW [Desulfuromonadaceae bacterium]
MDTNSRKFLLFSLSESFFAIDLAQLSEVCDPPTMWPIPFAPACYRGAFNFHGEIVAVLNLAYFLEGVGCSESGKLIVINPSVASVAFSVDTVVKIVSENDILSEPTLDIRFSTALLKISEMTAILLDIEELVRSAEQFIYTYNEPIKKNVGR